MNKTIILIPLLLLMLVSVSAIDNASLDMYYKLDNSLVDSAGVANNMLNTDMDFSATAKLGTHSIDGDDGDDYIVTNDNIGSSNFDSWCLSWWWYPDAQYTGDQSYKYLMTTGTGGGDRFNIITDGSNANSKITLYYTYGGGAGDNFNNLADLATTTDTWNSGEWYHLVFSYDDTTNEYTVYVNNTQEVNHTDANMSISNLGDGKMEFNSYFDGEGEAFGFNAKYDEIAIFNRSCSPEDVSDLWNTSSGLGFENIGAAAPPIPAGYVNVTLTAIDNYANSINTFNATINTTTYGTTTGTITTLLSNNSEELFGINYTFPSFFNQTNVYNNINVSTGTHQATNVLQSEIRFQAKIKVSKTYLQNFTVNDSTITNTTTDYNATLNLLTGNNQAITFNNSMGYFNQTLSIDVSNFDNRTHNITIFNHELTIAPRDFFTNASINNFTINISADGGFYEYYVTSGNNVTFNVTSGYNYTININVTDYASNTTIVTNTTGYNRTTYVQLFKENSLYVRIYDEETGVLITDRNVSVEVISDSLAEENLTDTGALIVENLIADDYRIRYSAREYFERLYFLTVTASATQTVDVYLLNSTKSDNITVTVLDEKSDAVEKANIKLLRYYLSCNCYRTVEIGQTNFEGKTGLRAEYNSEFYKFIIEYEGVTYLETDPFKISSTELTFFITLEQLDPTGTLRAFQNVVYNLTFNNVSNTFRFTFSQVYNQISSGCLKVYRVTPLSTTLFNSSCVNSTGATLLVGVQPLNNSNWQGVASLFLDGEEMHIETLFHDYGYGAELKGRLGLFLATLIIGVFALISIWNPTVSVVMMGVGLIMVKSIGLISLSQTSIMAIIGVIIVIIMLNRS